MNMLAVAKCPICLTVPANPRVACTHGHVFCQQCLKCDPSPRCPTCRTPKLSFPLKVPMLDQLCDQLAHDQLTDAEQLERDQHKDQGTQAPDPSDLFLTMIAGEPLPAVIPDHVPCIICNRTFQASKYVDRYSWRGAVRQHYQDRHLLKVEPIE